MTPQQYHGLMTSGGVADLSDRVKLRVTGADRVRYLNGQLTSNVAQLRPGSTQPACVTTAKGRLCAEVLVTATDEALLVDGDSALAESLPARLERYIVADDVAIEVLPASSRLWHFLGPDPSALESAAGRKFRPSRRFGLPGWDLWANEGEPMPALPPGMDVFAAADLETLRIERGVPRWGFELTEETLPPEAGLERTHIDYHKGCYIGQEVISRLKSVGHVNRQLTGLIPEAGELRAGMLIFVPGSEKSVGAVTSSAWSFALEKPVALGYLRRGTALEGLLARADDSPEVPLHAQSLPFVS